ncbi:MAG: GTPase Era [Proteobacteria bacterium]|nr:GTPase Era [Pseudomonadota bacterium]
MRMKKDAARTPSETATSRCIVTAVMGPTNAGKSTLVNALTGSKISIVTPKVQTTRSRVIGLTVQDNTQFVFIDTPGIFAPKRKLDKAMVKAAWEGLDGADAALLVIDVQRGICEFCEMVMDALTRFKSEDRLVSAVINKVDTVPPDRLLILASELGKRHLFDEIFMVSALKNDGVDAIMSYLAQRAPEMPFLYPEDQAGTMPMRQFAAEITREKLFLALHQEIPYGLVVETEQWEDRDKTEKDPNGSAKIQQVIYVERESHKKMVIGAGGALLKRIGETSRRELEKHLSMRVHLFLFVKVREQWQDDRERYVNMGLEFPE